MIKYYRTMDHQIHEISEPMEAKVGVMALT